MGKYMRERRGLGKMDASLGILGGGVRTRARALAMAQQQYQEQQRGESSKPSSVVDVNLTHGCQEAHGCTDHSYMELRSRRLEKVGKRGAQMPVLTTVHTAESPGRTQLQCSVKESAHLAVVPTRSSQSISNSVSVNQSRTTGVHNRIETEEQEECLLRKEPENEERASPICSCERQLEVERGFADSPLATGSLNRASSLQGQVSRRPSTREATPESFIREVEAPGSSSRTRQQRGSLASPMLGGSNAQISSEIQEFFDSFEQQERRRFMDRYNFDPLMEKPLQGRYDWTRIE